MFKPVKGPKEGRSPPGLLYSGNTHGRFSNRQISLALIVAVCLFMGYFVYSSDGGTISSVPTTVSAGKPGSGGLGDAILNENIRAPPADSNVHEINAERGATNEKSKYRTSEDPYSDDKQKDHDFKPIKEPLDQVYQQPAKVPSIDDIEKQKQDTEEDHDAPGKPKGWRPQDNAKSSQFKSDKSAPAPPREKWSDRPEFEKSLTKVLSLLPDEVHMRELIRPVEGSGKEKMREMGLRTRAYRKYFEAWEALHMTTDSEGATYIRDDVIPYMRSHQQSLETSEFSDEGVDGLNLATTIRQYEAYRVFMVKFAHLLFPWTAPYFADHMTLHASIKKGGRGIVLTAGDDQAPYLLTTIYSFRQLGCTLPIEVMYLGDQDLGEDYRAELEALPGVITRDIAQMTNDAGWALKGWAAKPFAILLSSFREVIFIDADSLFFRNPEDLFEERDYKRTGALFFRDRLIMPENKKRWLQQVLPKPIPKLAKESRMWTGESGHMQESGVVVVDKWKHFIAMMLITRFNGPDRDGNKEKGITGVYDMMYGDKETFWIGFLLAGDENYAFHKGDAGIMGELGDHRKELKKSKRDEPHDEQDEHKDEHDDHKDEGEKKKTSDETSKAEGKSEEVEASSSSDDQEVLLETHEEPTNYTICAPQLLHLDEAGKPYWFNGWLLHNKFADKHKKRFAKFDYYLIEPKEVREPGAWQLAESNMCCLTTDADKMFEFSTKEKDIMKMIMERAKEMGMGDQT
ncbi:hypothetical protein LTR64_003423 [Lithohypha guttulata]|uniref:uncharacterized protein n=1 Tax=Lithohypha guttulata TaxID=1690604 RepID=UPI002DE1A1DC|nr:hypothetical protein LTR51_000359 [Lithohypha guttulata]